jgi:hypothetical protein
MGKEKKYIDFNWKFFPDRDNRKTPDSRDYDCEDPFQLLRWRNDVRLFVINWRNVWYTYRYLLNFWPFLGLLAWVLTGSCIAGASIIALYVPIRIFLWKKISFLDNLVQVMPAFIDRKLIPVFGKLLPFTSD